MYEYGSQNKREMAVLNQVLVEAKKLMESLKRNRAISSGLNVHV
jgi:hypothetical protein